MRGLSKKYNMEKGKVASFPSSASKIERANKIKKRKPSLFLISMILFYFVLLFSSQIFRYFQLSNELKTLEKDIERATQENAITQEEIEMLKDFNYIEELARGRLGMVRPGEVLFHINEIDESN